MGAYFAGARSQNGCVVLTHDQNLGRGGLQEHACRVQAIHAGHADIQKDEIGKQRARFFNGLRAILRFAANLPVLAGGKNALDALSNPRIVVGYKNSHANG